MLFEGLLVFPICRCSPTVLLVLTKQGSRAVRSRLPASRSVSPSLYFCWYVCLPLFSFLLSLFLSHTQRLCLCFSLSASHSIIIIARRFPVLALTALTAPTHPVATLAALALFARVSLA